MLNLPEFNMPPERHQVRKNYHVTSANLLKKSLTEIDLFDLNKLDVQIELPDAICLASNPKWAHRTFGAVNTVQKSACVCFTAKVLLDTPEYQKHFGKVSMEEIFTEAETKGYRLWKLANRNKTLSMATPSVTGIQKEFPLDEEIQKCTSLEQIYAVAGRPTGIGGSLYFIDNIIAQVCNCSTSVGYNTRLHSLEEIVENLKDGFPVPVRVENSIYHNDSSLKEGHYVTIFGFKNGFATIVDSSSEASAGITYIPMIRLFNAMIATESLICAWNTRIR